MKKKIKVEFLPKIPKNKVVGLYYYDLRHSDGTYENEDDNKIKRSVWVNHYCSMACDVDILKNRDYLLESKMYELYEVDEVELIHTNRIKQKKNKEFKI